MRFGKALAALLPLLACAAAASAGGRSPNPANGAPARWAVAYDFVEALAAPGVVNPNHAGGSSETVDGRAMPGIFQHPDAPGKPPARLTFPAVRLPKVRRGERLALQALSGIRDGFSFAEHPEYDGVEFRLEAAGRVVVDRAQADHVWRPISVDLTARAGTTISVTFQTSPRKNSGCDWAAWVGPQIVIVGRRAVPPPVPAVAALRVARLDAVRGPSRIALSRTSADASTVVAVLDRTLDLHTLLTDTAAEAGAAPVPLAPEMAVGEGEDATSHTLVRVLSRWGIPRVQFLAFGPEVTGGVTVCAGRLDGVWPGIAAAPLSASSPAEVRVFDDCGGPLATLRPPASVRPPYVIAVGDFVPGWPGDEIVVASRDSASADRPLWVSDARGRRTRLAAVAGTGAGRLTLTARRTPGGWRLCAASAGHAAVMEIGPGMTGHAVATGLDGGRERYPWPLVEGAYATPMGSAEESALSVGSRSGAATKVDVAGRERLFWAAWYDPAYASLPDGRYTRKATFRHLRTEWSAPGASKPGGIAANADPAALARAFEPQFAAYPGDQVSVWEPCFTHRQPKGPFQAWRDVVDRATGRPVYTMLTRKDRAVEYGEFGNIDFYASTYAPGLPALERLYISPLRAFLRRFAPVVRANPEKIVCLEPNHEHEIAVEADGSMGDYNTQMIAAFHAWLTARYGAGMAAINRAMGTRFTKHFDAPRNMARGGWDDYSPKNPFYREWTAFNRSVVNRRIAQTLREALLAGFPPEIVKSHQIPDTYAIGNLSAFSTVTSRFTPIDWMLNAGTGYGFTRYGVWFNQKHDALQDANSAGFDQICIGEYQALTPKPEDAWGQLRYMIDHGCIFAHCMMWPKEFDNGFNATMDAALRRAFAEDRPKPGVAGGVGQVRALGTGSAVVCVGAGPERNGLLKSVRADGSWEGSVYVTPFRSRVDLTPLATVVRGGRCVVTLPAMDSGAQVELLATVQAEREGTLRVAVCRGGRALPGLATTVPCSAGARPLRYILRAQQPAEGLTLELTAGSGVGLTQASAILETERTPKLTQGQFQGAKHRGGVTFDILPAR